MGTNAHILLELEGVEAGAKECGECEHNRPRKLLRFCRQFTSYLRESQLNTGPDGRPIVSSLRCPECLEAEKRAMERGKVTKEQRDEIIELLSDDQIRTARKYFDRILDILGLEVEGEKAKEGKG